MSDRQLRLRRFVRRLKDYFQGEEPIATLLSIDGLKDFTVHELVREMDEAIRDGELGEWENYGRPVLWDKANRPEKEYHDDPF